MTIEQQVNKALQPLSRFVARADRRNGSVFWNPRVEEYIDGTGDFHTARLRLDYELSDEARETKAVAEHMVEHLKVDLVDLVRNGDVDSDDPLLKVLDGAVKREVDSPKSIDILEAVLYTEYKAKKESTEYTMFLLFVTEW